MENKVNKVKNKVQQYRNIPYLISRIKFFLLTK